MNRYEYSRDEGYPTEGSEAKARETRQQGTYTTRYRRVESAKGGQDTKRHEERRQTHRTDLTRKWTHSFLKFQTSKGRKRKEKTATATDKRKKNENKNKNKNKTKTIRQTWTGRGRRRSARPSSRS
jgi:hypothetical protein